MGSIRSTIRTGHELRRALREWLSPPDPSVNYNTALESRHEGTATWFTHGHTFANWKQSGSLLWIYGNRTLSRAWALAIANRPPFS
jgi:hypothetical protein